MNQEEKQAFKMIGYSIILVIVLGLIFFMFGEYIYITI